MERDGNASDHLPRQAVGILQDELVAGPSGQPESIHPQALLAQVLDRFIQQAIAQVISAQWEPHFHRHSYGFRPERSAHQAVREVQGTIRAGYGWVVDMDLQAFFDRVNHDRLMARLKSRTRGNTIGVIVAELRKALLGWKAYFGIAEVLFGMAAWLPLGFALDISPSLGTKLAV